MRQTQFKRVVILSAELSTLGHLENTKRTANLEQCIKDIGLVPHWALGVCNRNVETSYVVICKDDVEVMSLINLATKQFKQEMVLVRNTAGEAFLVDEHKEYTSIGELAPTPKVLALNEGSYTLFNDVYYTTKVA